VRALPCHPNVARCVLAVPMGARKTLMGSAPRPRAAPNEPAHKPRPAASSPCSCTGPWCDGFSIKLTSALVSDRKVRIAIS
jgi:hypothetical protein